MRQGIILVLWFIFGSLLLPPIWDRIMSAAPEVAWRGLILAFVCISVALVVLNDWSYPRLIGNKRPLFSTVVIGLCAAVVAGSAWWLFVGSQSKPAPQASAGMPRFDGEQAFAYMRPQPAETPDGRVRLAIWNRGNQVLSGVRVRMFETDPDVFATVEPVELQIGTLPGGRIEGTSLSIVPFNGKSFRLYRFEIISESVSVDQTLLFRYNERLKTLDDMTTVTHLPSRIVDGRLQILLHQDWHEWTPPIETNDPEAKEKRGAYADFMKNVDETWLSAISRKPDLDQRLASLEHAMNLIRPFIPKTRDEWNRDLQSFKSLAFRVSTDPHPRSADVMRQEGIDFAVFKQNFQEGIYVALFPGARPFERVTKDDVKSIRMGRD